jgi:hypothetical protein
MHIRYKREVLKAVCDVNEVAGVLSTLTQFEDVLEKSASTNHNSIGHLHYLAETLLVEPPADMASGNGVVPCNKLIRAVFLLLSFFLMDFGEGIKHEVAVKVINVRHLIDVSPSTLSLAKEVRYCIIALVLGFGITTITRSYLASRNRN